MYGVLITALCLAAPVRPEAEEDSPVGFNTPAFEAERAQDGDGEEQARKPARRRARKAGGGNFDPKVFEARGRELKGEPYVISSITSAPTWSSEGLDMESTVAQAHAPERKWLLWGGAAGLTVLVAGAAGWLLLDEPEPGAPVAVHVSDQP